MSEVPEGKLYQMILIKSKNVVPSLLIEHDLQVMTTDRIRNSHG